MRDQLLSDSNNNTNGAIPAHSAFSSNNNSDAMLAPTSQDMFVSGGGAGGGGYSYYQQHPSADGGGTTTDGGGSFYMENRNNSQFETHSVSGYSSTSYGSKSSKTNNNRGGGVQQMSRAAGSDLYANRIESGLLDASRASTSLLSQKQELDHPGYENVHLFVMFACFPIFCCYGSVVSLQERIRDNMNITGSSPDAQTFDYAISSLFYVILAVRFFHNVIFSFLRPRSRVLLGYVFVIIALVLLVFTQFLATSELGDLNNSNHLYLIFLIYALAGVGISTFECNFVSCITPLGPTSKKFSILSMPLGYNGISIAAFAFFAFNPDNIDFVWITLLVVAILNVIALLVFVMKIPDLPFERTSTLTLREFLSNFTESDNFSAWTSVLLPNFIAFFCDMFVVILLSGAPEFVYNMPHVPLIPHSTSAPTIPKNVFLAVFNVCAFLGDLCSRFVGYRVKDLNRFRFSPMEFMLLSIAGGVMAMSTVAFLAWPGMFLAMFANGFIYSSTMRRLDRDLDRRFHLTALSLWLLTGDAGSCIGSTLTHKLSRAVGTAG